MLKRFAASIQAPSQKKSGSFLSRMFGGGQKQTAAQGIYLDGGFGVGKTHLLASLWHDSRGQSPSAPSWSTPTWSAL